MEVGLMLEDTHYIQSTFAVWNAFLPQDVLIKQMAVSRRRV